MNASPASELQQYMILLKYPADAVPPTPEEMGQIMARFNAWMEGMCAQGRVASSHGLTNTGKMLRGPIGRTVITDGPFAEGKEVVGGYVLLNACTMTEALQAAGACPGLDYRMIVEVRPVKPCTRSVDGPCHAA